MEFLDKSQLERAKMEDTLTEILYRRHRELVIHGGTAIWRCYSGNRFSRDIDFYFGIENEKKRAIFFNETKKLMKNLGYTVKEGGYDKISGTMHVVVESNSKMKIAINFRKKTGVPAEYTKVDDTKMFVLALIPSQLLTEKIEAYENKMNSTQKFSEPEVQDLYDMYHLTSLIMTKEGIPIARMRKLVKSIEREPPKNLRSLDDLILNGVSPSFEMMINYLKTWLNNVS
ncbi:MAG: nucleotidyl transferase AbiEii/AbiGii toxin family protein [Thermoplasmatales archaeon]|nr:nucleotidyl transferase AbiEii/AbiGii toxin family protein [Candidatus Thermoplasmatota archaeon]MCL6002363.1 nucleotidyl transferase AbiEii/AbiGii toxin family protein [Candidatus Thermoplasmatota archaeon]MDA8054042.1 nucleotidyl transferase AbiEii/AbiGii toxin family protein [Thermoplasmatales archaeon]